MDIFGIRGKQIVGRHIFVNKEFEELFIECLKEAKDYIEIGTLFGASAILAGLECSGDVYCIDPLDGYYGKGRIDPVAKLKPSPEIVRVNWDIFGLEQSRLHIFAHKQPPFPEELEDKRFDVGYIDGDHSYAGAKADFLAFKDRVDKYIIFHDINKLGIMKVYEEAQADEWKEYKIVGDKTLTGVLYK